MVEKEHWETVYKTKNEKEVSWYQAYPQTSIDYITALDLPLNAKIIDVGGGDSYLADALLEKGYNNITILDIAGQSLEKAKLRLGIQAQYVTFIESDILDFVPNHRYDFWHDRACLHFQTTPAAIQRYAAIAAMAVVKSGTMLIGVFSDDGPSKCSGLFVKQYNTESMRFVFEREFELEGSFVEDHTTPFDTKQNFIYCGFKRKE